MPPIRQLLDQKGTALRCIQPDASVFEPVAKMAKQDIGSLVVMEGDRLIGIITERPYARNVVPKGKTSPKTPVSEIMESNVIVALPEHFIEDGMAVMTKKHVGHLPICVTFQ